ncbi:hypothetical protein LOC73_35695, partial [Mycolicibacterium mageritense]|nr:hypothetical protein [Mycolicibacterium mageritense]
SPARHSSRTWRSCANSTPAGDVGRLGVVADAIRRHPVTALDTRPLFAPADDIGAGPHVQLWPHRHGTDAMFAAALKVGKVG